MIKLTKGFTLPLAGGPISEIESFVPARVGLLGSDYPRMKPQLLVKEGERVRCGQALFHPKEEPRLRFVAPIAGRIQAIQRGPQRVFEALVIEREGDEVETIDLPLAPDPLSYSSALIRTTLLASGLWPAFRTRPFHRLARADREPFAIFVNLMDSNPLAPDMRIILKDRSADLITGLSVLLGLTSGSIYVCHGPELVVDVPRHERWKFVAFAGPHPAGLSGTHIHHLAPVDLQREVWSLEAQDLLAIGCLFRTGKLELERTLSLGGPGVVSPHLIRCPLGSSLLELTRGRLGDGELRIISGSVYTGRAATSPDLYLGRYHQQVVVLPEDRTRQFLGWAGPGLKKFSLLPVFWGAFSRKKLRTFTTRQGGQQRPFVPVASLEKLCPLDIEILFLLRALLAQDDETAEQLGVLELVEEDLGLLSYACPSKSDYARALRDCLDRIAGGLER